MAEELREGKEMPRRWYDLHQALEQKTHVLTERVDKMEDRQGRTADRVAKVEDRQDKVENRQDKVDRDIFQLHEKMDNHRRDLLSAITIKGDAILKKEAAIAKNQHLYGMIWLGAILALIAIVIYVIK